MEVSISPSTIVPEVLKKDNYGRWSILMKHYLKAQGLWDVVQSNKMSRRINEREWTKKNDLALLAIKILCATEVFEKIKMINSAKEAWDALADMHKPPVGENREVLPPAIVLEVLEEKQTGPENGWRHHKTLLNAIYKGKFERVQEYLKENPNAKFARILPNGYTALHVAITAGEEWIAEHLINSSDEENLEIKDNGGNTALSLAACNGMMGTAKCLIRKSKELLKIPNANDKIPVQLACGFGHEAVTRYLYRETPLDVLDDLDGDHHYGFNLLEECITKKMFDVAFDLLSNLPKLASDCPPGSKPIISTLAQTPPPFFRESQLALWPELWIYNCIRVKPRLIKPRNDQSCARCFYETCERKKTQFHQFWLRFFVNPFRNSYESASQSLRDARRTQRAQERQGLANKWIAWILTPVILLLALAVAAVLIVVSFSIDAVTLILIFGIRIVVRYIPRLIRGVLRELVSVLSRFLAKQMYDMKLMDKYACKVINLICQPLSELDPHQFVKKGAVETIFKAIENGIPNIVIEIAKVNENILWSTTDFEYSRNMFASAISHHQEEVARFLFYEVASKDTNIVLAYDEDGNNTLHLAAMLSPHFQLGRISGAALQLQSELRWFKAVEGIVPRFYIEQKNEDGETPFQVFVREHTNLLKEAEEWIKKTAESSTVVAALIVTIMFAVAFTLPGGNDQSSGIPIFLPKKPIMFKVFMVSDAISLFAASGSVLMFLGILTSRYAYEDFLKSLPRKLIIGLCSLFISIATMMIAFCVALFIMLRGELGMVIPISLLGAIPVTFFVLLQSPLLVEIYTSTFSPDIFDRKRITVRSKLSKYIARLNGMTLGNFQFGDAVSTEYGFWWSYLWS